MGQPYMGQRGNQDGAMGHPTWGNGVTLHEAMGQPTWGNGTTNMAQWDDQHGAMG